ncbi:MAG: hypothetical protein JF614_19165 [Acidobacteria bacterium]|nr:hypothetical protein [Acidobacteriota bacterium]
MDTNVSIAQVLSEMETQIAHHESQEAFHAQQEVFHRDQRALHAETLAKERYEAFRSAVAAAGEVVQVQSAVAAPAAELVFPDDRPITLTKLVARLIVSKGEDETFTPWGVARELNQRFPAKLRHPVDGRALSVCLRRLLAQGRLSLVKKGGAVHEAIYGQRKRRQDGGG